MKKGTKHRKVEKTISLVIVPRFGTDFHTKKPNFVKEFEVPSPDDIKVNEKLSSKKMKTLRKQKRKEAIDKTMKLAQKEVNKLGSDQCNILIKKIKTSQQIYLPDGVTRNTSKR